MNVPYKFEEYVNKGIVKRKTQDKLRAYDLVNEAERKFNSLNLILNKIGLSDENANDVIEYCYDIIINLTRAKMLLEGFSATGMGAHEAEIAYLRKLNLSELDVRIANQLRYFRNGIMYYGKKFDSEYAKKIIKFLNKIKKNLER